MDGMRMVRDDKDRIMKAVKSARYTIHKLVPDVAFVERASVDGEYTDVETLIKVSDGYEVISFSKKIVSSIHRDKSGRLICTCYLKKPCKHLLAVREVELQGLHTPSLKDMFTEMLNVEDHNV
jgi:hypothetical protein